MTSSLRDVSRERDRPHCAVLACVPPCEARRKVSPLHGSNDAFWPHMRRVLILGAAGRDFHDFNVVFRNNPEFRVVAFTATQIPDIAGRRYPAALAGELYPDGIPILEEDKMEQIIRDEHVDEAVFAYSDVPYATLMHLASRVVAAGADFQLLAAERTQLACRSTGGFGVRGSYRLRQEPGIAPDCGRASQSGLASGCGASSDAVWRPGRTTGAALRVARRS